jgi:UrcA family protein
VTRNLRTVLALVAVSAALALPAFAQVKPAYDPYYDDEIVIIAPEPDRYTSDRSAATGARIETVRSTLIVSAADLDLRYESDADELRRRIRDSARDACADMRANSRGVALTSDGECLRGATRDAMAEAEALISYRRG